MSDDDKKRPALQNHLISAAVEIDPDDPLARVGIGAKPCAWRRRLRQAPPSDATPLPHSAAPDAAPQFDLVSVLREQIQQAQERENRTWDQLQQVQQEKARLLSLLEAEQQARGELETKLLPAPKPVGTGNVRVWALVIVLLVALVTLVVALIHPKMVGRLTGG